MAVLLTTPIHSGTATQYEIAVLNLYLLSDQVNVKVLLEDQNEVAVQTANVTIPISSLNLGPGVLSGITNAVIQALKQQGVIN